MQVKYSTQALKFLSKINRKHAEKIIGKINQYAAAPETLKNQVKKLQGIEAYRLRVADYRVIFDKGGNILHILKIASRGSVYK